MSAPTKSSDDSGSHDFVKQSSLYQEFLAEREEILRHKWLESERLGYDIGFERALLDWIRKHREGWRAARRPKSTSPSAIRRPGLPGAAGGKPSPSGPGSER
jgi:hypothetical protein